jgi:hypothetical protein
MGSKSPFAVVGGEVFRTFTDTWNLGQCDFYTFYLSDTIFCFILLPWLSHSFIHPFKKIIKKNSGLQVENHCLIYVSNSLGA